MANIRFEESQKNQKKMEEFKQQNEKKYLENFRKIKEREDNAIKLCKSKISVYSYKYSYLEKIIFKGNREKRI